MAHDTTTDVRVVNLVFIVTDYATWDAWFATVVDALEIHGYTAVQGAEDENEVDVFFRIEDEATALALAERVVQAAERGDAKGVGSARFIAAFRAA